MKRQVLRPGLVSAKNALRPFLNSKPRPRWHQFQAIRREIPLADLPSLYRLTESNIGFFFDGLGGVFPKNIKGIPDSALKKLEPVSLKRETELLVARLNHHKDKMSLALESLRQLNQYIIAQEWEPAFQSLQAHLAKFGTSLISARKELFIAFNRQGVSGLSKSYKTLISPADRSIGAVLCHVTYDLTDPAFHPSKSAKLWIGAMAARPPESRWWGCILEAETLSISGSVDALAERLLRYGATTLLDVAVFLWKAHCQSESAVISAGWARLDSSIRQLFEHNFVDVRLPVFDRYKSTDGDITDIDAFRASYFFSEYATLSKWRADFNALLFSDSAAGAQNNITASSDLVAATNLLVESSENFGKAKGLINSWLSESLIEQTDFSDSDFVSSVVVATALKACFEKSEIDDIGIIKLISETDDLQDYMSVDLISRFVIHPEISKYPLLEFIIRDLAFKKVRSQDNDLERRASFMIIFATTGGRQEIMPFLESVFEWNSSIAVQIGRTCTRTFLERLFMLMTSVKDVLETRISLCDWLINKDDIRKDTYIEEKEALDRELSNLDARSDLDSTRVHVDEESLHEWFADTQYPKVSRYIQTVLSEGRNYREGTLLEFYNNVRNRNKEKIEEDDFFSETQIGSEFILLAIVEETLRAFISDRSFGLDGYLSRRIRHGTLSGFVTTPLSRVLGRVKEAQAAEERPSNEAAYAATSEILEGWRIRLLAELDHARRKVIQVRSDDRPDGLIQPTWRAASSVTHIDAMMARVRSRVVATRGEYDFFSDIYAVCWDVLERDLAQVRRYILQDFYRPMLEDLNSDYQALEFEHKKFAFPYVKEAMHAFEQRSLEICGWFIRPVFRRDNYELRTLADSTVSIVRELDAGYKFSDSVIIDREITISRASFEVLGDILFILIGNAAKHGKSDGLVQIDAALENSLIKLTVKSESSDYSSYAGNLERIEEAFAASQALVDDAAVDEGFSGIRKIVGLLGRTKSAYASVEFDGDDDRNEIIFTATVPADVAFRRERS